MLPSPQCGMTGAEMKTKTFQQMWIATGLTIMGRLAEAQAATPIAVSAETARLASHPVFSVLVHIFLLAALLGVGSTIVAALIKPPFRE